MKKLYLLLVIVCLISCTKDNPEQGIIVNNQELQKFLLRYYDKNNDGILSNEEALEVTVISIIHSQEPIDGLEHFPNLENLHVPYGKYTELDVSKNIKLKQFNCRNSNLSSINLSNNPNLEALTCRECKLSSLILANNPELVYLSCGFNNLVMLDLRNAPNLIDLDCTSNFLKSIILSNSTKLFNLRCIFNNLEALDVSACSELNLLSCSMNSLTELDVSNNSKLGYLECRMTNKLQTLYLKTGQVIRTIHQDVNTTIVYLP